MSKIFRNSSLSGISKEDPAMQMMVAAYHQYVSKTFSVADAEFNRLTYVKAYNSLTPEQLSFWQLNWEPATASWKATDYTAKKDDTIKKDDVPKLNLTATEHKPYDFSSGSFLQNSMDYISYNKYYFLGGTVLLGATIYLLKKKK